MSFSFIVARSSKDSNPSSRIRFLVFSWSNPIQVRTVSITGGSLSAMASISIEFCHVGMHMANVLVCGTKSGRVGVAKNALLFGRMISPSIVTFHART
jgi:hypothetical protein